MINEAEPLEKILESFITNFNSDYKKMILGKLGIFTPAENDEEFIAYLESNLQLSETDMTIFYRNLNKIRKGDSSEKALQAIEDAFYKPEEIKNTIKDNWLLWFTDYLERLNLEDTSDEERIKLQNSVNPKYVLRNYMAQLAIDDADKEDYSLISELYELLKKPYDEQPEKEKWFAKRPDWARSKVGCSMLSCSS